jgi:hypothetical protein
MTIPSAYLTALVAALVVLLVAVSAVAGWLWCRLRSLPSHLRVAQLARDLADRQRALEALIERLDPRPMTRRIRLDPPLSASEGPSASHLSPRERSTASQTPAGEGQPGGRDAGDRGTAPTPSHLSPPERSTASQTPAGEGLPVAASPAPWNVWPAPTLIAVPDLAAIVAADEAQLAEQARTADDLDQRHGALWTLSDSGYSADAIARQTGLPIGQVELILALRRHAAPRR